MDHLDWFSPGSVEVQEEVDQFKRVLAPGGMVFWRSASRKPWYNEMQVFLRTLFFGCWLTCYFIGDRFQQAGFEVTPVAIRTGSIAIDRVNMSVMVHSEAFTLLNLDPFKVRLLLASSKRLKRTCYFSRNKIFLEIRHKLLCDAFFPPVYRTLLSGAQSDCLFMDCYEMSLQPL
jgi:Protein of unknown function (DUF3419)